MHLDGSLRLSTLIELARENGVELVGTSGLRWLCGLCLRILCAFCAQRVLVTSRVVLLSQPSEDEAELRRTIFKKNFASLEEYLAGTHEPTRGSRDRDPALAVEYVGQLCAGTPARTNVRGTARRFYVHHRRDADPCGAALPATVPSPACPAGWSHAPCLFARRASESHSSLRKTTSRKEYGACHILSRSC